jgi:hypothetical protein
MIDDPRRLSEIRRVPLAGHDAGPGALESRRIELLLTLETDGLVQIQPPFP